MECRARGFQVTLVGVGRIIVHVFAPNVNMFNQCFILSNALLYGVLNKIEVGKITVLNDILEKPGSTCDS